MKIFYWSTGFNNFGDELNPWLIPKLYPKITFDNKEDMHYIGIGTLLNSRLPISGIKYVMGSGVGYGDAPKIDDSFRMYGVRGPLSCRALGIDEGKYSLSDPAMLVAKKFNLKTSEAEGIGFMPHCQSDIQADWKSIANSVGFEYISPRSNVEDVIKQIAKKKLIITEALHGAIVADAFRIPWIPVTSNDLIFEFKWHDWLASIGMEYKPTKIHEIVDRTSSDWIQRNKDNIKRIATNLGVNSSNWTPPRKRLTTKKELSEVQENLSRLPLTGEAFLSRATVSKIAIEKLETACEKLQLDYLENFY